ncbi:5093_t:CDS:2, partial [Dentiscutata heterogama]
EITFKSFTRNSDSLVTSFEKNSIVLMVGHYVCEDNSVSTFYSDDEYTLTQENLPNLSPLLLYSAPVVPNLYIPDNNGEVISRIQKKASSARPSHTESTQQVINEPNLQNTNETLTPIASFANKTNTSINNNIPIEPTHSDTPILQGEKSDTNKK